MSTPIYPCHSSSSIVIHPTPPPAHPLQLPTYTIPSDLTPHLSTASAHLHASRTVAFATETVYGLGASSLDPTAISKIYSIKNRPSDNPLIIHVSSLDMLNTLLPPSYTLSPVYMELITRFWPGPLTLLFPAIKPPPPPAPQTNAIRMPLHPLALALINHSNLPISAPSANSSGRPSPTKAIHVFNDLNGKEGLGCILDGGDCGVGVESTVVDGLGWKEGGGGYVDILRPGGMGVERIAEVVQGVDERFGGATEIRVKGERWVPNEVPASTTAKSNVSAINSKVQDLPPSTPGQKYRHYSPRIPVYLFLPSNTFPAPTTLPSSSRDPRAIVFQLVSSVQTKNGVARVGVLHFQDSPLFARLKAANLEGVEMKFVSLGEDAESAAKALFSGILSLEGPNSFQIPTKPVNGEAYTLETTEQGVDMIFVEGCTDTGLGLAFMERVGKSVGGGGKGGDLGNGEGGGQGEGRFWVEV